MPQTRAQTKNKYAKKIRRKTSLTIFDHCSMWMLRTEMLGVRGDRYGKVRKADY